MKHVYILAALMCALPFAADAIEPDQVRGEIVSTSPNADELTIRVTESGDEITAEVGSNQTFEVPPGTQIEYEIDRRIFTSQTSNEVTLDELAEGDSVLLKFETAGTARTAVNIRNERTSNTETRDRVQQEGEDITDTASWSSAQMAANDSDYRRSELPATASALPALFGIGLFLSFVAIALGVRRQRARESR